MVNKKTTLIPYEIDGAPHEGFLAYDADAKTPRPGIIICHAWRGRDEFVEQKAQELVDWGYTAFALDLYGKGIIGKTKEENMELMGPLMVDRNLLRRRLTASLEAFKSQASVDKENIAALGFCFGGLCALDMARMGADLKAAISVHGLLNSASGPKPTSIKPKIMVFHGSEDPLAPYESLLAFEQEMSAAKADWQVHIFGNTLHAFTTPTANDPAFGTVYNELAAKRTFKLLRLFLEETFTKN